MAVRTIGKTGGGGAWNHGWHEITLKDAKYGTYNDDVKYVDMWFEEYPSTINLRVYEAKAKNGEEFAIARLFKLANAGIIGEVAGSDGRKMIQFDDDAKNLKGCKLNVFFYKNEEGFFRVLNRVAPVKQGTKGVDTLVYTEDDVAYWKNVGQKHYEEWKKPSNSDNGMLSMNTDEIKEVLTAKKQETSTDAPF